MLLRYVACSILHIVSVCTRESTKCRLCRHYDAIDPMEFWDITLQEDGIVPEEMLQAPNVSITAYFNQTHLVPYGCLESKKLIAQRPQLSWPYDKNAYYTVIMTHLGMVGNLSILSFEKWHHWLVINVPELRIDEGETISEYFIPTEPLQCGVQKHLFWVFKQPGKVTLTPRDRWWLGSGRISFNATKFAKKYNMTGPIAILHFWSYL